MNPKRINRPPKILIFLNILLLTDEFLNHMRFNPFRFLNLSYLFLHLFTAKLYPDLNRGIPFIWLKLYKICRCFCGCILALRCRIPQYNYNPPTTDQQNLGQALNRAVNYCHQYGGDYRQIIARNGGSLC